MKQITGSNEEIRLLAAFLLSIAIIVIFSKIYRPKPSSPALPNQTPVISPDRGPTSEELPLHLPGSYSEKLVPLENDLFLAQIDTAGGKIKSLGLKKYHRVNEDSFLILSDNFSLLDYPKNQADSWINTIYTPEQAGTAISLKGTFGPGVTIQKIYTSQPTSHTINCKIKLSNNQKETFILKNYCLLAGLVRLDGENLDRGDPAQIIIENNGSLSTKILTRIKGKNTFANSSYIGFKSRYKLILLKPEKASQAFVEKNGSTIIFGISYPEINLASGTAFEIDFSFYAGPSDFFIAGKEVDNRIFGKGFFVSMGRLLFAILKQIQRLVPNWGWAIVLLTLLVKLVFYPLTRSSLRSMKQMQKLRPYMKDLQTKYKDNPKEMQKELMNLYREYKINPLSGCIPMLIQFPIFVGLFLALRSSVFLRGAPFILWIKDLSEPDCICTLGSFPVNILPLLMAGTSYWQQKLTPQEPSQKSLAIIMPLMFLFLFYNFSAGLLLYWVTMNLASLLEQYLVSKHK